MIVHLAMTTTMILWGVSFVASKLVLEEISPLTYMGVRFLLASVLLAGVMALRGRPRFPRKTHGMIALTALAEPVAYFLFETFGLTLLSPSIASLIIATTPLAVMLLAAAVLDEPLSRRGIAAVFFSITGISLLVLGNGNAGALGVPEPGQILGIFLIFGAVLSAACYITLARSLTQRHDPVNLTVIQTWWGAGVFIFLWRIQPAPARALSLSPLGWGAVIFLAAGATVAAFLLYNWALRYETAGRASLYINAIPVITAITSWFVLGERLSAVQATGALLVLLAVRFSSHPKEVLVVPPEG